MEPRPSSSGGVRTIHARSLANKKLEMAFYSHAKVIILFQLFEKIKNFFFNKIRIVA